MAPVSTKRIGVEPKTGAVSVAAGMLMSKVAGLISFRLFAHYFGLTDVADAFRAAFRIPSFLQNLFGEGVLSASFIPVYARLRAEGDHQEATRLAQAIFALVFLCTSLLVLLGVAATPWLIALIAPGFHGEKRELTIHLVRISFPGVGLLVLSAWALGVLNSHHKFLLSYAAPVLWQAAMIAAFVWQGPRVQSTRLAIVLGWSSVVGSALQFAVQLPAVSRFVKPVFWRLHTDGVHIRTVLRNFFPMFLVRGVVQISGYIHSLLASLLPTGAVAALTNAQTLYALPVILFAMSISAAELPTMSRTLGSSEQVAEALRGRLSHGLEQIAFFVVPSTAAFLVLGKVVVATLYQTGVFGDRDVSYVWGVLAGAAIGLMPAAFTRLYSSTFYALRDTRTPVKFAMIRVALTGALGYIFAVPLPGWFGIDRRWGVAGLTLSAALADWIEYALLHRAAQRRIGMLPPFIAGVLKLWMAAMAAAIISLIIGRGLPPVHPVVRGIAVLVPYGLAYLGMTQLMGFKVLGSMLKAGRR